MGKQRNGDTAEQTIVDIACDSTDISGKVESVNAADTYSILVLTQTPEMTKQLEEAASSFVDDFDWHSISDYLRYSISVKNIGLPNSKSPWNMPKLRTTDYEENAVLVVTKSGSMLIKHPFIDVSNDVSYSPETTSSARAFDEWLASFTYETLPPRAFIIDDEISFRVPNKFEFAKSTIVPTHNGAKKEIVKLTIGDKSIMSIPMDDLWMKSIEIGVATVHNEWYLLTFDKLYVEEMHDKIVAECLSEATAFHDNDEDTHDAASFFVYAINEVEPFG